MARSKKVEGTCRICGLNGPLSFEHVPPRAAFNDRPVVRYAGDVFLEHGLDVSDAKGSIDQKGSGAYTLCPQCNNNTGSWYGGRFVECCFRTMEALLKSNGQPTAISFNGLLPLPILKQVITMFFSVNGDHFREAHPELVRLVLNRDQKYLPPDIRLYAYSTLSTMSRHVGVAGVIDTQAGTARVLSELSFPPLGFVMTFNSLPLDPRLIDITHFSRFDYEQEADFVVRLPVLEVHLPLPGDYRSRDEIERDARRNDEFQPPTL